MPACSLFQDRSFRRYHNQRWLQGKFTRDSLYLARVMASEADLPLVYDAPDETSLLAD